MAATLNNLIVGDLIYNTNNEFEVGNRILGLTKDGYGEYTIYTVNKVSDTKYILGVQYDTYNTITIVREASSDTNDGPSSSSEVVVKP